MTRAFPLALLLGLLLTHATPDGRAQTGSVADFQKISSTQGGFTGPLADGVPRPEATEPTG